VLSVVGDVPVDSETTCGDLVNLEYLPTRSSKMLLEVGFARVRCVVSVSDVLCNLYKHLTVNINCTLLKPSFVVW
jgi:hypothetical protein